MLLKLAPIARCRHRSAAGGRSRQGAVGLVDAREAVTNLWVVDPVARTLEVSRLEQGRWLLLGTRRDEARVRAEPFAEFELDLGVLWSTDERVPAQT